MTEGDSRCLAAIVEGFLPQVKLFFKVFGISSFFLSGVQGGWIQGWNCHTSVKLESILLCFIWGAESQAPRLACRDRVVRLAC